jgi:hypothetical protein
MNSIINVLISNYNAANQGIANYIGLNDDKTLLVLRLTPDATTTWTLIPNLPNGAVTGGFTLYNAAANQCAVVPGAGGQVGLNDDPTPYGALPYCWTFWQGNLWNGQIQLWAIQDSQRGLCMDAAESGVTDGTPILGWSWNGGDNQQWFFALA